MQNIKRLYQKALKKYPVRTQAVQAGLGSWIIFNCLSNISKKINLVRDIKKRIQHIKILRKAHTNICLISSCFQVTDTMSIILGILMGLGDQIAQNFIDDSETIDFVRTIQFAGIGLFISGPTTRIWYGILDKYIGSKGYSVAIKKVACDQLFFAPTFLAVLLVTIGICQEKDIKGLKVKMTNEYSDILMNNYKLWPMVQIVNFSLVPLHYQALIVQTVALLWNSYISYRTSLEYKSNKFR